MACTVGTGMVPIQVQNLISWKPAILFQVGYQWQQPEDAQVPITIAGFITTTLIIGLPIQEELVTSM